MGRVIASMQQGDWRRLQIRRARLQLRLRWPGNWCAGDTVLCHRAPSLHLLIFEIADRLSPNSAVLLMFMLLKRRNSLHNRGNKTPGKNCMGKKLLVVKLWGKMSKWDRIRVRGFTLYGKRERPSTIPEQ
jgi:hypothetical protein